MPNLSPAYLEKLATCDQRLQDLFVKVSQSWPCGIAVGYRDQAAQDAAVAAHLSKDPWPTSKHNGTNGLPPSKAVDAFPLPLDWNDRTRFVYFAGFVMGVAALMGIPIRWGGDWAGNWQLNPNGVLDDLDHFELVTNAPTGA